MQPGRHTNADKDYWAARFHLSWWQRRHLNQFMLTQLKECYSDEARRILLGKSEKEEDEDYDREYRPAGAD